MSAITPKHARALAKLLATKSPSELRAIYKKVKAKVQLTTKSRLTTKPRLTTTRKIAGFGGFEWEELPITPVIVAGLIFMLFIVAANSGSSEPDKPVKLVKPDKPVKLVKLVKLAEPVKLDTAGYYAEIIQSKPEESDAYKEICRMQSELYSKNDQARDLKCAYLQIHKCSLNLKCGYLGIWAREMVKSPRDPVSGKEPVENYIKDSILKNIRDDERVLENKINASVSENLKLITNIVSRALDEFFGYADASETGCQQIEDASKRINAQFPIGKPVEFRNGEFFDWQQAPVESGYISNKLYSKEISYVPGFNKDVISIGYSPDCDLIGKLGERNITDILTTVSHKFSKITISEIDAEAAEAIRTLMPEGILIVKDCEFQVSCDEINLLVLSDKPFAEDYAAHLLKPGETVKFHISPWKSFYFTQNDDNTWVRNTTPVADRIILDMFSLLETKAGIERGDIAWCHNRQAKVCLSPVSSMYMLIYQLSLDNSWGYLGLWAREMSDKLVESVEQIEPINHDQAYKETDDWLRAIGHKNLHGITRVKYECLIYILDRMEIKWSLFEPISHETQVKAAFWHRIAKLVNDRFQLDLTAAETEINELNGADLGQIKLTGVFGLAYERLRRVKREHVNLQCGQFYSLKGYKAVESGNLSKLLFTRSITDGVDKEARTKGITIDYSDCDICGSFDDISELEQDKLFGNFEMVDKKQVRHTFNLIKINVRSKNKVNAARKLLKTGETLKILISNVIMDIGDDFEKTAPYTFTKIKP